MIEKNEIASIRKAHLQSYKSIKNCEVAFEPGLNIVIGKNASGKSNFLMAVYNLMAGNYAHIPFESTLELVSSSGDVVSVSIKDSGDTSDKMNIIKENITINEQQPIPYSAPKITQEFANDTFRLRTLLKNENISFNGISLTQFELPERFKNLALPLTIKKPPIGQPQSSLSNKPEGEAVTILIDECEIIFGTHLPKGLISDYNLNIENRGIRPWLWNNKKLLNDLATITPIQDVAFNTNININSKEDIVTIENIHLEFLVNGEWLRWSNLSDGTQRLFYLIYTVSKNTTGSINLVEEPELGVHPHQFQQIMSYLKQKSTDGQVIVSTHSPQALNVLKDNELDRIIICEYLPEKGTQFRRLTEEQKQKAVNYMNTEGLFLSDYWIHSDLEG